MSVPVEPDFALIKIGNGATPTEAFTVLCGIQNVTANMPVNTNDRARHDCQAPGRIPIRTTKRTSKQLDITGSGVPDADMMDTFDDAIGEIKNYRVEMYQEDGTDAGKLLWTYAGPFRMTSLNITADRESDAGLEIALANQGPWTRTNAIV